jgi:TATA-box binding protein (TBP) (component of TFIID and TFIIIB)
MSHGVKVDNVIAVCRLTCGVIDPARVASALGVPHNDAFPSCVFKCGETNTTLVLLPSGRLITVGAKTESAALYAIVVHCRRLSGALQLPTTWCNFEVRDVIGTSHLGYKLNLNLFIDDNATAVRKDRGVVKFTPSDGGVCFALFGSGHVVSKGRSTDDLHLAYNEQVANFARYKKGEEYRHVPHTMEEEEEEEAEEEEDVPVEQFDELNI